MSGAPFELGELPPGEVGSGTRRRSGAVVAWRLELAKLSRLLRVQITALACVAAPLLVAGAISVQSALPQDTLFGQWLHESGFALPLVVLGFAGQWLLPLLASLVAGDVFSSEDHLGTWKTVLTRSRTRGQLFTGKLLAVLTYVLVVLGLLAVASLLSGLLLGVHPLVGLSGQLVSPRRAWGLVAASWASEFPPVLGFCALAVLLSITTRSSVVGMGGPVLIGFLMQVSTLVNLPAPVRISLLSTPFVAWHGLWTEPGFIRPLEHALITSAVWFALCLTGSWLVFRRRSIRVS